MPKGRENIQHPTSNPQRPTHCAAPPLDVGCWALDVGCSPFTSNPAGFSSRGRPVRLAQGRGPCPAAHCGDFAQQALNARRIAVAFCQSHDQSPISAAVAPGNDHGPQVDRTGVGDRQLEVSLQPAEPGAEHLGTGRTQPMSHSTPTTIWRGGEPTPLQLQEVLPLCQ